MEIGVSQRQRIAGANRHRGPAVQPLRVHQGVPSPASTAPRVWCFKRIKVPTGTERHDVICLICLICIMHYFLYIYTYIIYIRIIFNTTDFYPLEHLVSLFLGCSWPRRFSKSIGTKSRRTCRTISSFLASGLHCNWRWPYHWKRKTSNTKVTALQAVNEYWAGLRRWINMPIFP